MRTVFAILLALAIGLLIGTAASAQTTINPWTVEFVASADHSTTLGGTAILTRYELRIFLQGATQPMQTTDLGKPTPGAGNLISVTNPAWFTALAMNSTYTAKVAAIGPAGEGSSASSNPFGNAGPPAAPIGLVVR